MLQLRGGPSFNLYVQAGGDSKAILDKALDRAEGNYSLSRKVMLLGLFTSAFQVSLSATKRCGYLLCYTLDPFFTPEIAAAVHPHSAIQIIAHENASHVHLLLCLED